MTRAMAKQVFVPHKSMLDLLDEYPSCAPPFEVFLDMTAATATALLFDLLLASRRRRHMQHHGRGAGGPALSGRGSSAGSASNYLAAQPADATVYAFVRKPTIPFHPPENPHLPMIMIGPGTGVAPFRGFLSSARR